MRNLFKLIALFIASILLLSAVQNSYAQNTDTQKVVKPQLNKKKTSHSLRDSIRQKQLQRSAMIRSFKHSDAALNDLLGKIESYTSSYVDASNNLDRGFDTVDISTRLPTLEHRMVVMKNTIDNSSTIGYIVTIRDMIDRLKKQTDSWQKQLNTYSDALDTMRRDISDFNADTTLKVVPADSALMVKSITRIDQLKQKWKTLDELTQKDMIRIGVLENRVSALSILLIDLDNRIDLKIHQFTQNAMNNEYGYIWDMNKHNSSARLDTAIVKSYDLNSKLYKYFFISKSNYWPHWASLLLLSAFLIWIYSSKRKLISVNKHYKTTFEQTHYIVKHPYLSAITVATLIAPYFYDHPAQIFVQTLLLIMMGSIGIMIKNVWPKPLYNLWKLLLGLTVVFTISNLMIIITNTDRLILLVLSAVAIYYSYQFLKDLKRAPDNYPPLIGIILKIFIVLQFISIVLNVFGRFSIAKIVGATATFNLCLAMGLYLLIQILMESLFLQLEANKRHDNESVASYLDFKVLQKKFKDVLIKIVAILWLIALAKNLAIDDYLYDEANDFLDQSHTVNTTAFTFRSILVFFIIIWISGLVARVISYFYDFSAQQTKLSPQAKKTRSSILLIRLTIFTVGFFVAITAAGIPMDRVTIVIGALGVGIGFGLQNIVNNLVSGVILAFEKPVQVGDVIEVGGKSGTIKEIGIRSSKIACGDGSELILPNGDLISQHVINWTLSNNNRRVELIVGVAYGSDIVKVETILKNIVTGRGDIMQTPAPSVFLHNFSESSIDFRIWFWAADISTWLSLKSKIISEIYIAFAKEGIEIPHPKRDIQVFFPDGTNAIGLIKEAEAPKENPPGLVQ